MAIPPGTYTLGPGDGTLTVRTGKAGAAAKAGHDLVIEVTRWEASLEVGEGSAGRVALDAAPDTLQWDNGAFVSAGDAPQAQTIADIALYAHGSGALPPGVEGGLDAQTVYTD